MWNRQMDQETLLTMYCWWSITRHYWRLTKQSRTYWKIQEGKENWYFLRNWQSVIHSFPTKSYSRRKIFGHGYRNLGFFHLFENVLQQGSIPNWLREWKRKKIDHENHDFIIKIIDFIFLIKITFYLHFTNIMKYI